jgi:hypothetical protein
MSEFAKKYSLRNEKNLAAKNNAARVKRNDF